MSEKLFRAAADFTGSLNGWSQIRFTGGEFYVIPEVLPMQTAVDWQKRGRGKIVTKAEADAELAGRESGAATHQAKQDDAGHQEKADASEHETVTPVAATETDTPPPTVRRKGSRRH